MEKTKIQRFKEFINSKNPGSMITREALLTAVDPNPRGRPLNLGGEHTADHYRKTFELLGYIEKTDIPGLYMVMKPIPWGITLSQAAREAYPLRNRDGYIKNT